MTTFQAAASPDAPPPPDSVAPRESTPQAPTSVSRLNESIRDFVARWGAVWVEGEITAWNLRGNAVYGRIKDLATDATISVRVWSSARMRMPADLKVGDHVIACVKADYFVKAGDFSFQVSSLRHVGLGDQLEKLERLRVQLRQEGLFDSSRKKSLPFLPRLIGLVTGERSDAEKDVHRNAELRWPQVRFRTEYAAVQGDRCVPETLAALRRLDADPEVDVIVIARGGGDPQTLLGFSDERLLRAVAAASTPIVSAIGHENDRPLLDDVADLRASTPTDAAKRVVPDVAEQLDPRAPAALPPHDPARASRHERRGTTGAAALAAGAARAGEHDRQPFAGGVAAGVAWPRAHRPADRARAPAHARAPGLAQGALPRRHAGARIRHRPHRRAASSCETPTRRRPARRSS